MSLGRTKRSAAPLRDSGRRRPAFVTADKAVHLGAITITPGGFLAAESLFRSRTTQSDTSGMPIDLIDLSRFQSLGS